MIFFDLGGEGTNLIPVFPAALVGRRTTKEVRAGLSRGFVVLQVDLE
jgi:hypothetical protein